MPRSRTQPAFGYRSGLGISSAFALGIDFARTTRAGRKMGMRCGSFFCRVAYGWEWQMADKWGVGGEEKLAKGEVLVLETLWSLESGGAGIRSLERVRVAFENMHRRHRKPRRRLAGCQRGHVEQRAVCRRTTTGPEASTPDIPDYGQAATTGMRKGEMHVRGGHSAGKSDDGPVPPAVITHRAQASNKIMWNPGERKQRPYT
ncbi:hypothetical protein EVG20_g8569 [Dentipellis fragilis]|uniref:Uncharacterized protein n=1 Tax=Dentipellis fragilis TaxID=205917 RepID=A0A4Y9Y5H1_9AGAM|nr:hypothetical protein EVG20_g8569 [Dentipellis fragilis]